MDQDKVDEALDAANMRMADAERFVKALVIGIMCDEEFEHQCDLRGLPVGVAIRAPLDYMGSCPAGVRGPNSWVQ